MFLRKDEIVNIVISCIERAKKESDTMVTYSRETAPGVYYSSDAELKYIADKTGWEWDKQDDYIAFHDKDY